MVILLLLPLNYFSLLAFNCGGKNTQSLGGLVGDRSATGTTEQNTMDRSCYHVGPEERKVIKVITAAMG